LSSMVDKLEKIEQRFNEIQEIIENPDFAKDQKRYKEIMQELSSITSIVEAYGKYKEIEKNIAQSRDLVTESADHEMKELAKEELKGLEKELEELSEKIKVLLIPKDPLDLKNIIMEIRAGTGGEEAALFASDLFRMYTHYAEGQGWKIEILSSSDTGIGGLKEIIFSVTGKDVYANLRYESGVHRVQRVPVTEAGGRIHTSAVTVAVLPEAEETDIDIKQEELKIDVFRSSGPGGQSVNTTDSAVRVTHLPTGLVVSCQDEKSQHKNRARAMKILQSRLFEQAQGEADSARSEERRLQVGSGDRSERIRTYNFPQSRLTDHRINLTLYRLEAILEGGLDPIVDALVAHAQADTLGRGEA
jgi:peptide chain release factor 1